MYRIDSRASKNTTLVHRTDLDRSVFVVGLGFADRFNVRLGGRGIIALRYLLLWLTGVELRPTCSRNRNCV